MRSDGFTLIELLVGLLLSLLLLSMLFSLFNSMQRHILLLEGVFERDQNLMLAPLLLTRLIKPAGCHRSTGSSVELNGRELTAQSDIDGNEGFPDGRLESSFEEIGLSAREGALRLRSGSGRRQPLVQHIERVRFERVERTVRVELTASLPGDVSQYGPLALHLHLWNLRTKGGE